MSNDPPNKPPGEPEDFWNPQPAPRPSGPAHPPTSRPDEPAPDHFHELELVDVEPPPAAPDRATPEDSSKHFHELELVEIVPTAAPAQAAPSGQKKMVVCNHCGHQQAGGKLCDACGLRIDAPGALLTEGNDHELAPGASKVNMGDEDNPWVLCAECGHPNRPEQLVCRNCQALLIKREIY